MEYSKYQAIAANTKIFFGSSIPDIFMDPSVFVPNNFPNKEVTHTREKVSDIFEFIFYFVINLKTSIIPFLLLSCYSHLNFVMFLLSYSHLNSVLFLLSCYSYLNSVLFVANVLFCYFQYYLHHFMNPITLINGLK